MKKKWIQVTNKRTYLCFILPLIGLLKIICYDIGLANESMNTA